MKRDDFKQQATALLEKARSLAGTLDTIDGLTDAAYNAAYEALRDAKRLIAHSSYIVGRNEP